MKEIIRKDYLKNSMKKFYLNQYTSMNRSQAKLIKLLKIKAQTKNKLKHNHINQKKQQRIKINQNIGIIMNNVSTPLTQKKKIKKVKIKFLNKAITN